MLRNTVLGLEDELIASVDPWLCYYCGDCSSTCPKEADPGELYNVVDRFPEVAGELFQLMRDMYIQLGSKPPERK